MACGVGTDGSGLSNNVLVAQVDLHQHSGGGGVAVS
jgi:hypothetical protein